VGRLFEVDDGGQRSNSRNNSIRNSKGKSNCNTKGKSNRNGKSCSGGRLD